MDDKQCETYRDIVEEKLAVHDKRLDDHSERLHVLEGYRCTIDERIINISKKIDDLTDSVRWFNRGVIGAWIGLIIFLIQQAMVK